jgi:ParB family chromosome partitioning protein
VVRPLPTGQYELIAGERRWRAAQLAGLHEIPAVVRDVPDQAAMAMGLIENIQRDDLNPLEEATALNRLLNEFGLTHQAVAQAVGKSRAMVSNLLRLLELNDDVKEAVQARQLEMGHARALLGLRGAQQSEAARHVVARGLSVRETEALVRRLLEQAAKGGAKEAPRLDPDIRKLQENLCERLGARVEIRHARTGKGRLVIAYNSLDELDGILDRIR